MGDGMPFVYEKGPVWSFYDRQFAPGGVCGQVAARLELLNRLRQPPNGNGWADRFVEASGGHPTMKVLMPQDMEDHIRQDWFTGGMPQPGRGWLNWQSNPAELVCKGFARALEISLGVDHVDLVAGAVPDEELASEADATRCWPIEFWWLCPLPVFQCWVAWRPPDPPPAFGIPHAELDELRESLANNLRVDLELHGEALEAIRDALDAAVASDETPEADELDVNGLVSFTFATPAPAYSYLAKHPADDGLFFDAADSPRVGPLGRSGAELAGKNAARRGLVVIGDADTVSGCYPVPPPHTLGVGPDTRAEFEEGALMDAMANSHNMFNLPSLAGDGDVVTVSPYNDVGGYNEGRTQGAAGVPAIVSGGANNGN